MGQVCSCTRSQEPPTSHGFLQPYCKAASHEDILSTQTSNNSYIGCKPRSNRGCYINSTPVRNDDQFLTSSPYQNLPTTQANNNYYVNSRALVRTPPASCCTPPPRNDSQSTLDESGISSRGSSLEDNQNYCQSTSAPSTPSVMFRKKPPPKPPRMKGSVLEHSSATLNRSMTPTRPRVAIPNNTSATMPLTTPPPRSPDIASLKSSLADVTNALDVSVSTPTTPDALGYDPRPILTAKDKADQIMCQAKEVLAYEMDPELLLLYLREHGVFNSRTELQLRRCRSKHTMATLLMDIVCSKGQRELDIFCQAVRTVGRLPYIADFLEVLNMLLEAITADHSQLQNGNTEGAEGAATHLRHNCPCVNNNNNPGDILESAEGDHSSFEVEIYYCDSETGQVKPVQDVVPLKITGMRRTSGTEESILLRSQAERCQPVLSLDLFNKCLCHGKLEVVVDVVQRYPFINKLSLGKNSVNVEDMCRIGHALQSSRHLAGLDVRLNHVGDRGITYLAEALKRNSSLRVLNVASTGLTSPGCRLLMASLARNHSLTDLDIGFNDLQDSGCEAIANLLACNGSLRKLRMRDNYVTPHGAKCIFKSLKKNSKLFFLDMSSNKVGDESLAALSDVLLINRTLRDINLEKCHLTGAGCEALSRALKTNTVLRSLDLSLNILNDRGVAALAEGMKYNQVLETLCLNMCGIGNLGCFRLLDSLNYNATLTALKLCYNNIGHPVTPLSPTSNSTCDTGYGGHSTSGSFFDSGSLNGDGGIIPSIDELYEKLCQVLQQNKDLKVLLWGNCLDGADTSF